MHVVIAWWDGDRSAGIPRQDSGDRPEAPDSRPEEFPGLRMSRRLTDPSADRQGLALLWDSPAAATRSLPALAATMFGCAPSHRWSFELEEALQPKAGGPFGLPQELSLLLHA
ncbi:hypothetical protein ACFRMQ_02775 [Kitasatospora sp. NPDC056783]|uniref:hypothetical protein n=1 Tax=Kitasatospora sp. NPDC056783 TaxID=3345943 RepID=UPI0036B5C9DB